MEILRGFLRTSVPEQALAESILDKITVTPSSPQRASELVSDLQREISRARRDGADVNEAIAHVVRRYQDSYRLDAREVLRQKKGVPADEDLGRRAFMIAWA